MAAARMTYLPALDGLRAVAVTLVVAYHLDVEWARGGFLGVDLFFVISGFLITTLLLREHDSTGRIALGSFWTRRFRRLVPPLVVMTAATVAATRLYSLPEQWSSIRWDAAAAVGYVANWRFILDQQSYFETLLGPSPLRHTWSLAVEEQWYVLWPAVVLGLLLLSRSTNWRHRIPMGAIVGGTAASALLMAVLYDPVDPTRVYFGTDTRAQQLLVGAGLAWLSSRHRLPTAARLGRSGSVAVIVALAVFILIAATTSDESAWLYHGGFVAVSLLCAVIVWAVAGTDGPLTWLGARPLVWIGTRSYAIYLWHWPVIVFVGAPMGLELSRVPLAALQVALSLVLAELSFRLVERPIRGSTLRPAVLLGGWTAVSAATALVAVLVLVTPEGRSLDAVEVVRPSITIASPTTSTPSPATEAAAGGSVPTPSVDSTVPAEPSTVLLLGDSTAVALAERRTLDPGPEWNIQTFARLGCSISGGNPLDVGSDIGIIQGEECSWWRTEWADAHEQVEPDVSVVMVGAWEVLDHLIDGVAIRFPDPAWFDVVREGVREAVEIAGAAETLVTLLAVPCMRQAPDTILSTIARNDPARVAAFNEILRQEAARHPNVHVIDLNDRLCPQGTYLEEVDGAVLRYDGVHVTAQGADYVWTWLLDELETVQRASLLDGPTTTVPGPVPSP
jgi:peptidoglycan/LPS O-acetylase OafA/YrhL/lysophospholipase L1-like esterase